MTKLLERLIDAVQLLDHLVGLDALKLAKGLVGQHAQIADVARALGRLLMQDGALGHRLFEPLLPLGRARLVLLGGLQLRLLLFEPVELEPGRQDVLGQPP